MTNCGSCATCDVPYNSCVLPAARTPGLRQRKLANSLVHVMNYQRSHFSRQKYGLLTEVVWAQLSRTNGAKTAIYPISAGMGRTCQPCCRRLTNCNSLRGRARPVHPRRTFQRPSPQSSSSRLAAAQPRWLVKVWPDQSTSSPTRAPAPRSQGPGRARRPMHLWYPSMGSIVRARAPPPRRRPPTQRGVWWSSGPTQIPA